MEISFKVIIQWSIMVVERRRFDSNSPSTTKDKLEFWHISTHLMPLWTSYRFMDFGVHFKVILSPINKIPCEVAVILMKFAIGYI